MHPFTLQKRKLIVLAKLKGPETEDDFKFILDTGAGTSVIDESVAMFLGYNLSKVPARKSFVTVSGRVSAKMIQLHKMELFGKSTPNFPVSVVALPFQISAYADGLVGMDLLQHLKNLKIHFDKQTIEVE